MDNVENPYVTPDTVSKDITEIKRSKVISFFAVLLTILSILIYGLIYFAIPEFEELFKGMGAELPSLTILSLKSYQYSAVFLLVPLISSFRVVFFTDTSGQYQRKQFRYVWIGLVIALIMFFLLIVPMYLPVMYM